MGTTFEFVAANAAAAAGLPRAISAFAAFATLTAAIVCCTLLTYWLYPLLSSPTIDEKTLEEPQEDTAPP